MRTQIPITGISSSSAYTDGDCLSLVNLRKKNGVMKPVTPRKIINTLNYAYDALYVHQLPNTDENWIGIRNNKLYWIENQLTTKTEHELCLISGFKSISQIGNILNVLDATGLQYVIWYEGEYKLINANFDGSQTDTVLGPVKVDLKVDVNVDNNNRVKLRIFQTDSEFEFSSSVDSKKSAASSLMTKSLSVNRKDGYLHGFIMACTAIELYDGSYILHSNPMLLCQSYDIGSRYNFEIGSNSYIYNGNNPVFNTYNGQVEVSQSEIHQDGYYNEIAYNIDYGNYTSDPIIYDGLVASPAGNAIPGITTTQFPNILSFWFGYTPGTFTKRIKVPTTQNILKYKIRTNIIESLRPIIKNVSVFITPEIEMYDFSAMTHVERTNGSDLKVQSYYPKIKTNETVLDELSLNQQFYKVHEISFDELRTITPETWLPIDLKGKLGDALINQEELPVDNFTHHALIPQKQMVYNSKLHEMDYKIMLSRGWPMKYLYPNIGIGQFTGMEQEGEVDVQGWIEWIKVRIKTETGISEVVRITPEFQGEYLKMYNLSPMLSYPDSRAIELITYRSYYDTSQGMYFEQQRKFKLTKSENQNFAYYISPDLKPIDLTSGVFSEYTQGITTEIQRELIYRNNMKVSAVNNPFYFPDKSVFTIGTGFIRNAGTNAIRMSDGQFGQYDLYVFTSEGIYSLDTGTAITYNRISPSSTELPVSDIICSTPFGVVFIGKRGLFIINGQQVDLITPQLEQEPLTIDLNLPTVQAVPKIAAIKTWNDWFKEYLEGVTEIVYDNQNNEIIIINPTKDYNFVYNLDSKEFYQQTEVIDKIVGGVYPELLVTEGVNIKDFGQKKVVDELPVKANVSFITRPFNFGTTDTKKLERTILRSRLHESKDIIAMNLASNDGINFTPQQGKTFADGNYRDVDLGLMVRNKHKQFIYAFAAELDEDSQISVIDTEVFPEYTNEKMR